MKQSVWLWEVTQSTCRVDGAGLVPVYGVCVREDGRQVWAFPDVDTCRLTVEELALRLQETCPEPCHWAAIVEDFVAEQVSL